MNRALLLGAIRRRLGGAGAPLVAWVYTPYRLALDVLDKLPADVVVYHCTQAHRFRPGAPADTAQVEEALLERADVVIVDGVELERELVGRHSNLHRVPTGVDPAPYAGARPPGWMRDLPRPVVGYLGSVDHRIDVDVIAGLAKARPRWTLAVIGPVTDATTAELEALPNVILHGQVPPDDVPATLAGFDVGLLPYAPLDMTPYTYPAKLHQYFAAGLPVASVPLPDLEEFGELVNLGEGVSGLVDATERALAEPDTAAEARRRVAAQNSWGHRLDDLSRIVESALDARVPSGERHSKGPELVREKRERGEDRDGQRLGGDLPHPESDEAAQHDEVSP